MLKRILLILLPASYLISINNALADYIVISDAMSIKNYNFSGVSIPDTTGTSSNDVSGTAYQYSSHYSDTLGGSIELTINGTLLGDGKTYATSNPGVGIQYTLHLASTTGMTPSTDIREPPYRYTITSHTTPALVISGNSVNIWYRLVRLHDFVPAGVITSVPDVTLTIKNPDGEGVPMNSGTVLSGIGGQPKLVACNINAPTEIKLSPLYGNSLQNGAQNVLQAPQITLTNCPGAINGISYNFSTVYGTHNATNGVLKTVTGDGYAKNVYVQIQNADGTAHKVNSAIPLSNYDGSGDYAIPDFKVAYFIDDANTVTAGKVKTAIELKVTYN